jgi:hypothetical protein
MLAPYSGSESKTSKGVYISPCCSSELSVKTYQTAQLTPKEVDSLQSLSDAAPFYMQDKICDEQSEATSVLLYVGEEISVLFINENGWKVSG